MMTNKVFLELGWVFWAYPVSWRGDPVRLASMADVVSFCPAYNILRLKSKVSVVCIHTHIHHSFISLYFFSIL